jgi:D-alanyl-D-alanine dipeptidase
MKVKDLIKIKIRAVAFCFIFFQMSLMASCQNEKPKNKTENDGIVDLSAKDTQIQSDKKFEPLKPDIYSILELHDSAWVDLKILLPKAIFDIRYADTANFMKLKVYECPACYCRLKVAKALLNAQKELDSTNLVFKFFDCYRPSSAQWALWKKMPDPRYVHPPTQGSRHSRGVALDLTLFDLKSNKELDMGTEFDFFGKEAYWNYKAHSEEVNKNRKLLLNLMQKNNFSTVPTEWWHFDFKVQNFNLSDFKWDCN